MITRCMFGCTDVDTVIKVLPNLKENCLLFKKWSIIMRERTHVYFNKSETGANTCLLETLKQH